MGIATRTNKTPRVGKTPVISGVVGHKSGPEETPCVGREVKETPCVGRAVESPERIADANTGVGPAEGGHGLTHRTQSSDGSEGPIGQGSEEVVKRRRPEADAVYNASRGREGQEDIIHSAETRQGTHAYPEDSGGAKAVPWVARSIVSQLQREIDPASWRDRSRCLQGASFPDATEEDRGPRRWPDRDEGEEEEKPTGGQVPGREQGPAGRRADDGSGAAEEEVPQGDTGGGGEREEEARRRSREAKWPGGAGVDRRDVEHVGGAGGPTRRHLGVTEASVEENGGRNQAEAPPWANVLEVGGRGPDMLVFTPSSGAQALPAPEPQVLEVQGEESMDTQVASREADGRIHSNIHRLK